MSSHVWQSGSDDLQASMVGRQIGRGTRGPGRVTSRIGYTRPDGTRIVRKWDKNGNMVEEVQRRLVL